MNRALLIGINKYPTAPLSGCVNDCLDVASELSKLGYSKRNIKFLLDEKASKQAIVSELKKLVKLTKEKDNLYLHFSGHGVQMPVINDLTEIDGLDEVICPHDFNWSEETLIRDNELAEIFEQRNKGAKILFFSDSCHSGDLKRIFGQVIYQARTMPYPDRQIWDKILAFIQQKLNDSDYKPNTKQESFKDIAYISGCKSTQTSADAWFEGKPNGAATYYFLNSLRQNPTFSLIELIENVNTQLKKDGFTQEPQIEGNYINTNFFKYKK